MISFGFIQRIHRAIESIVDEGQRDGFIGVMKSMYPEAFEEFNISANVHMSLRDDGIELIYRGKRIGRIEIKKSHDDMKRIIVNDKMEPGFAFRMDNYGCKIIMFGSYEIYDLEFNPDKKKNRIMEAE